MLLEWFLAARWAGIDGLQWFGEFDRLDGDDMAFLVAAYRTHMQIEAVLAWAARPKRRST